MFSSIRAFTFICEGVHMHIIDLTQYTSSVLYTEPDQLCFDFDGEDEQPSSVNSEESDSKDVID